LKKINREYIFYHSPDRPFKEKGTWNVLLYLLNEDYLDMVNKNYNNPADPTDYLIQRLDKARIKSGLKPVFFDNDNLIFDKDTYLKIKEKLQKESKQLIDMKNREIPDDLNGKTIVIEFARGGADGSVMPIPYGYENSLRVLAREILQDAVILYIWVTPEESRRKNFERSDPNDPGSILNHSVPIEVMMQEYGCDDMQYIIEKSDKKGYVKVNHESGAIYLPVEKFDNRVDKTSFVRDEKWDETKRLELHLNLKNAMNNLRERYISQTEGQPA